MARLLFRLLQETTTSPSPSQVTSSPALNSDLILILATILCALICLLGLLAVSRCAWLRRSASNSNGNGSDQTPQPSIPNKGLKKKVLRSLPKLTYSPDTENFSDCAICLTEFVAGDELRVLPQCNHVFHVSCIDTWLGSHSSCPSCRQILVVTRCHKCGGLPGSFGSGSGSGSEPDNRVKQHHDNGPNPSDSLP